MKGPNITVISADAKTIEAPINGGGPNSFCEGAQQKPRDTTENERSVGFLLTYGKFKFLDLGDLTWDIEMKLACRVNKLGQVALFQATHHGFVNGFSGAPAMVWAVRPQVVVVNNGPRKGLDQMAWETIAKIQGLEGVWQSHLSLATDAAHNTNPDMIANLEPTDQCKGQWLKASVSPDGNSH